MEAITYDPVQGTGWDEKQAWQYWAASMSRASHEGPRWSLRGKPRAWFWTYFDFRSFTGRVDIEPDGFHWQTFDYDTGEAIWSGVTTSLYAAYQSVVQNKPVAPPGGEVRAS